MTYKKNKNNNNKKTSYYTHDYRNKQITIHDLHKKTWKNGRTEISKQ